MIHVESHVAPARRRKASVARQVPVALTEAQVRLMSDDEYMNPEQLAFFSALLSKLEVDLLEKAHRADVEIATAAAGADPVDRASAEEEHRNALSARARDALQLAEARAALARISAGEFGFCIETGEPIGIARLLIRPTSHLTIEAQQRQENMSRRFRT